MRIDGEMYLLEDDIVLAKTIKHTIEVVIDRLRIRKDIDRRLSDSLETALKLSGGLAIVQDADSKQEYLLTKIIPAPIAGISIGRAFPKNVFFQQPFWSLPGMYRPWSLLKN